MPALADLMIACHAALYRYARALCRDPEQAADLVQETYRRALAAKRIPEAAREEEVRAWLFTILRNIWQNQRRNRSHHPEDSAGAADELATVDTPETGLIRRLLQSEVRQAIDGLPAVFREVIVLREVENLSYQEIADVLQCPAGTVMSRLARARHLLRRSLLALSDNSKTAPGRLSGEVKP